MYHIVSNYNNLADMTIFCQGESIIHSPDFINLLKNRKDFEPIQPLSAYFMTRKQSKLNFDIPPMPLLDKTKNLHINNNMIHVEYIDNNFTTQYPYNFHPDIYIERRITQQKNLYNTDNLLEFHVNRLKIKDVDLTKLIPMCYSAIFSVNKNVIMDNSLDFYNNILNNITYEINMSIFNKKMDNGYYLGYLLEKTWLLIFNYKKYNKNYIDLNVNDYLPFETNCIIINNSIKFNMFNISFTGSYMHVYIDNIKYNIYIFRKFVKFNNIDYDFNYIIKDMINLTVIITLNNNILNININNNDIFTYKFKNNLNKITYFTIFELFKQHNFVDLN